MTDPLPRPPSNPATLWLHVLTGLAVVNLALLAALGAKPLYLVVGVGFLVVCASVELCCNAKLVRPWAVAIVLATLVLLAIGQFVTSFGAGMADPVWPTEPWYISHTATQGEKEKFQQQFAFFIEHTHRIVAWTVGGLTIVLAVGVLWTDPRKVTRLVALAGLVVLVGGYGEFHGAMMAQQKTLASEVKWPTRELGTTLVGLAVLLAATLSGVVAGTRGSSLRILAALSLVAVMIQGLLGGFRVKLNELVGTDLAAYHGIFAQVVFGLLTSVAVLTARRQHAERSTLEAKLSRWSIVLAVLIFVQVIFGAWVRHYPTPLPQRLHFLTAFLAVALAMWLLHAIMADPSTRSRGGWVVGALAVLLMLQIVLGVEAWMARFGQYTDPSLVKVTPMSGAIRSLHALVGSGVWAASLALALRLRRTADMPVNTLEPIGSAWSRSQATARTSEEVATHFRGDAK